MAKPRTLHICQECQYTTVKWLGKCPECGAWNSFIEELQETAPASHAGPVSLPTGYGDANRLPPMPLSAVQTAETSRWLTHITELDRVLGGGFVRGSIVILGGEPGIGKSTLALQIATLFAQEGKRTLYLSGEESLGQIKMRAERLGALPESLFVVSETVLEETLSFFTSSSYDFIVIDSVQTMASNQLTSPPGSVAQLREVTAAVTQVAKRVGIPVILIGHVTKQGVIAGPKVLEHMVDTVLTFEAQTGSAYRLLRATKNRFGSTNEVGVFEMRGDGLTEVTNPSAAFLHGRPINQPGSVIVPIMEGTRPLLCEIQALVSNANYGPARVTTVGIDPNRAQLLLNILDNRTGLKVAGMDVFLNVTGGMRAIEPAADLGILLAMLSSTFNRPIPSDTIVFGELGLTGELRAASHGRPRLREGEKLGFSRALVPQSNADVSLEEGEAGIRATGLTGVTQAIHTVFGDLTRISPAGPKQAGHKQAGST